MKISDSDRIYNVLKYLGISANKLAKELGISSPQVFYDIKAGKCGISKDLARKIQERFFNIDIGWLLTGEGQMIRKEELPVVSESDCECHSNFSKIGMVPIVDLNAVGSITLKEASGHLSSDANIWIPCANSLPGDLAICQNGESMMPVIPPGALLHIRRVSRWQRYLGFGGDFVLMLTDGRRIVKQVMEYGFDSANYWLAKSYNPEVADEKIPIEMVAEVWKVISIINNRGW